MARILVIEDNAANLELMTYLLKAFGHTPIEAGDGQEGVDTARRESPDLIVCDLQLPVLDGYTVVKLLKQIPGFRAPVIAVTAFAMVGDRERVLAEGFDGYIAKPIAPESFVAEVEHYLPVELRGSLDWLRKQVASDPAAPQSHAGHCHCKATILAVDNVAANLSVIRFTLEPLGYEVITAGSVEEALKLLEGKLPDLIVSDMQMPRQTGGDFARAVRSTPRLSSIPFIILCSTHLSSDQKDIIQQANVDRFLMRPIDPRALIEEIEACLAKKV